MGRIEWLDHDPAQRSTTRGGIGNQPLQGHAGKIFQHATAAEDDPSGTGVRGDPGGRIASDEAAGGKTRRVSLHLRGTEIQADAGADAMHGQPALQVIECHTGAGADFAQGMQTPGRQRRQIPLQRIDHHRVVRQEPGGEAVLDRGVIADDSVALPHVAMQVGEMIKRLAAAGGPVHHGGDDRAVDACERFLGFSFADLTYAPW